MQTYFNSASTPQATRTVAFLSVYSFYNSLLFIRVRIYKPDSLNRERHITLSELGPFWEGRLGGSVLCAGGGVQVTCSQTLSPLQYSLLCRCRWHPWVEEAVCLKSEKLSFLPGSGSTQMCDFGQVTAPLWATILPITK